MAKLFVASKLIVKEVFKVLVFVFIVLTLAEAFKQGYVSNILNVNHLLLLIIFAGIFVVLSEKADQVRRISRRTAQAVIELAVKSAHQAKQARLAAQHHAATHAHHIAPRTFAKPLPRPVVQARRPVSMDGVVGSRPTTSLRPEPKRPIIRHNPRPPGGLIQ
jgi:ABC-type nickel/cobalt efflux system permease component RcnA